jgi:hypothetical protein
MQELKQIVTVPETRELHIKLPADAVPQEEAEVIVLFKSNEAELNADLAAMREAGKDEMFLADLEEAMADFRNVDIEGALA